MWKLFGFILIAAVVVQAVKFALLAIFALIAIALAFMTVRAIYHFFNPKAKAAYHEKKEKASLERCEQERHVAEVRREIASREDAKKRSDELVHQQHRDGDRQDSPYTYQIGTHGNESLAIRYGIANQERNVSEYWYHAKGGEKVRNPERDRVSFEPSTTIRLQKIQKLEKDLYEVFLTDFRDRKAKVIIEAGTEYVKTFYPTEESWFKKHAELEKTLKGNGTFSLKELATFHVQKTVGG